MITLIDYGMGNLRSVQKGLEKVGARVNVTDRAEDLRTASGIILPGVGAFRDCIHELTKFRLIDTLIEEISSGKPYLGICLGLQILFEESEEFGRCNGLGIFKGRVVRFRESNLKIPHMGWNTINIKKPSPLLNDIPDQSYFYFVHSYYVVPEDSEIILTSTEYGVEFTSSVSKNNIFGVQFHPEKSQTLGLRMLSNFVEIVSRYKGY